MADFKIRKKISLAFIGDEYADSYIIVNSVQVDEYEESLDALDKLREKNDEKAALHYSVDRIKDHFVKGEIFDGEKQVEIAKEDIGKLDLETVSKIFQIMNGEQQDPKG